MSRSNNDNGQPAAAQPSSLMIPLRIAKAILKLPRHVEALYTTRHQLTTEIERAQQALQDQRQLNDELVSHIEGLQSHINTVDSRLSSLSRRQPASDSNTNSAENPVTSDKQRFADNHDLDEFYVGFEDKFRGDEAAIKQKVQVYPPMVAATGIDFTAFPVVDIGCGRGELLEAFAEHNIRAVGLDINYDMIERAKAHGYEAQQGDAVEYLRAQPANSIGAITGMHLVEHIPFDELITLFKECYRVLVPGGLVIFETPNPENLMVGIYSFYMDPSHLSPLPPPLLAFGLESVGFDPVETKRLHEAGQADREYDDPLMKDLAYRMYGPLDYAAIGTKPGGKKINAGKDGTTSRSSKSKKPTSAV